MTETDRLIELVAKLRAYHIISKRDEFIDAAEAIERLMVVLKPFADLAEKYDGDVDDQPLWDRDFMPVVGDLRAARAAFGEK